MNNVATMQKPVERNASVYCPICTHTVTAHVTVTRRSATVVPGQKCPRCSASLDAGYVMRVQQAA